MSASYETISKEVGYVGYMPFPSMEEMDALLSKLSSNPTISDFKKALELYRFAPEAKTEEESRMVYMLQLGLAISKEELFEQVSEPTIIEVAYKYILNLIPSLILLPLLSSIF
ncbi:MAG: hypothetical protein DHS20C17_19160 [Cyclobacteriaceae bacterium]|nr:MAG: hypothetical protein DHS20C17_19160 [Cyclobacteriaceae bacterium]